MPSSYMGRADLGAYEKGCSLSLTILSPLNM